ncbi:aconitase family protein [Aspergillus sclerotioniger CBS 115572]|uniref:Aconitase family protein n=1 Tax=Aspergillus sclerotioniger CBS 115572 TaxID=1450535 RepID=A0A317WVH6_9EURO|nr:aconitase family protein [Aspergillus sclerotioniger CBS 115572]PWY90353.1 aconitase family protein [Aspergillus sclerotioniger CBS 115572]
MGDAAEFAFSPLLQALQQTRKVTLSDAAIPGVHSQGNVLTQLAGVIELLKAQNITREANALADVLVISRQPTELGGLGLTETDSLTLEQEAEITFLVIAWLESLNSTDRARAPPSPLAVRPPGRRGMTLSEKIFAQHDIDRRGSVAPGELIRVDVDWVIASEASWAGMERTYDSLGRPGIYRNDRFWLAGDHIVDPRVNQHPKVQALIDASERAKRVFKMTDYQGMNYTILHTEFYRERAQPGMVVVGSDSHTCSSGALGCLAIGLGAADVTLPLVTGETWFKIPESVNIRLVGAPKPGIGGKDTILYILQQLKRNTVAAERIVEFTGPGVKHLSCDARFAISNMTTEFGGITGVFVADHITKEFVEKRRLPRNKASSIYFKPDDDAVYAETHEIDLGQVQSFMAKYPNPDDVVPVTEQEGMHLDGCFIGACTTAEEDLILGALVLEQGLQRGLKPVTKGKRKVVPGSVPILRRLRELGLTQIYEDAGFEVGIPGCSYCVGMSADKAAPGEVWISSQNRNFENRMGQGSIGNLASAATVAASSFDMKLRDPHEFLSAIDLERWHSLRGISVSATEPAEDQLTYVEPNGSDATTNTNSDTDILTGKVQRLGDFIDTDALAPAESLINMKTNEIAGQHCLEHTHPEFRQRVKDGFNIVVAGKAFGCGSSREQAVMALLGCGIQCIIAKSFAFIFQRNMPSLGLLGITLTDEEFYTAAVEGSQISIDFKNKVIDVDGRRFGFELSQMEKELFRYGGIASAFRVFGERLFEQMTRPKNLGGKMGMGKGVGEGEGAKKGLEW